MIERFNTDWSLQIFYGKFLRDDQRIRDNAIVTKTRSYLTEHVDLFHLQDILIGQWKRNMNNTQVLLMDATNANRRYATEHKIFTSFLKKGPKTDLPQEIN